jgi:hypothetical protein
MGFQARQSAPLLQCRFDKTVGYENGLIVVINEADGAMLKVVDIINKQLPANRKKSESFMEFDGIVYVSCDFGIVQFNLKSAFGDTYFIGDAGTESVRQTAIHNGFIYATNNGVRSASIINKNLNDYKQWGRIASVFGLV